MSVLFRITVCILWVVVTYQQVTAQCDIKNRISPNGLLVRFLDPVKVYWTESRNLYCGVSTDGDNYFVEFYPSPFPLVDKPGKLRAPSSIRLSDETEIDLENFDTRYINEDSAMVMLFMIDNKSISHFLDNEIRSVTLVLEGNTSTTYNLKLHKAVIREQLKCLIEQKK